MPALRTLWKGGPNDREVVRELQRDLVGTGVDDLGLLAGVDVPNWRVIAASIALDGVYGPKTIAAVVAFQKARGLRPDGVVGPRTWAEIDRLQDRDGSDVDTVKPLCLPKDIDIDWLYEWEDFQGYPYCPGGKSGVTLDPGFDLGYAKAADLLSYYSAVLTQAELDACKAALRFKGAAAKAVLTRSSVLRGIRYSEAVAKEVFPHILLPYWQGVAARFPAVRNDGPGAVKTVMLSLAYNRGVQNRDLTKLLEPSEAHDWIRMGNLIKQMQQDHELAGIRRRRRMEGQLILSSC